MICTIWLLAVPSLVISTNELITRCMENKQILRIESAFRVGSGAKIHAPSPFARPSMLPSLMALPSEGHMPKTLCSRGQPRTAEDPQPSLDAGTGIPDTIVAGLAMVASLRGPKDRLGRHKCRAYGQFPFFWLVLQLVSTTTAQANHKGINYDAPNTTETPLRYSPLRTLQHVALPDGIPVGGAQAEAFVPKQNVSNTIQLIVAWMPTMAALTILGLMQQARGARLARVPDPPAWNPDANSAMPFRTWTQRLMVWGILAVDLDPSQQCAAIVERLGGSARELADALSWQELTQGGQVGGQQLDPVTFLLTQLAAHYAPFGEEQRVSGMTELMSFHRAPNERTDALVARFRTLRWRAAQGGAGMLMNWEGYSWLLLRACGVNPTQLLQLLQPFQGRFPNTQQEFEDIQLSLRRMARILEGQTGNLASSLRQAPRNFGGWEEPGGLAFPAMQTPVQAGNLGDPWWQHTGGADPWAGAANAPSQPAPDTNWQSSSSAGIPGGGSSYPASSNQQWPYQGSSGTETDTSSDYDPGDQPTDPAIAALPPAQQDQHYWQAYKTAKKSFRAHFRKPTRNVRRFVRRKGKGKGKGKSRFQFLAEFNDEQREAFFGEGKGKGKGKGKSSAKGKGRRGNPTGRDGQVMKCDVPLPSGGLCNSDTHLRADHHRFMNTSGYTGFQSAAYQQPTAAGGPLDDILSGLLQQPPTVGYYASPNQDAVATPRRTTAEQTSLVALDMPLGGRLAGMPISSEQGIWGEVPPIVNDTRFNPQISWHQSNMNWQAPVIEPAPAENGQGSNYTELGIQLQQRQTLVQQVETHYQSNTVEVATSRISVQQLHTEFPGIGAMAMHQQNRIRNVLHDAQPDERQRQPAAWMTQFNQGGDRIPISSLQAVGESTMDTIIQESREVRNVAATLSADTRALRMQEASRQLATMVTNNPAIRLQPPAPPEFDPDSPIYETQDEELCVICQMTIDGLGYNESISLLRCNHYYHTTCIDTWHATQLGMSNADAWCPCCRGPIEVEHTFGDSVMFRMHQIEQEADEDDEPDDEFGTPSDTSQVSGFAAPVWEHSEICNSWKATGLTHLLYHAHTQIAGKLSMIVDPGAWISMFGKTIARALAQTGVAAGYKPEQNKLDNQIGIAGVGNGANLIKYNFDGPIAIPSEDGTSRLFNLSAGIVEEPGEELPGLLGMDVLRSRRAIMDIGNKRLIFPGDGEIEIILPPGSFVTPLLEAPSGHMVMVIDAYKHLEQREGGVHEPIQPLKLPSKQVGSSSTRIHIAAAGTPGGAVEA